MKRDRIKIRRGFTLVELLTTLAVIGVLLGLLIPALNQVGKMAANVKQKAQFHAIGTALEAFRNDYGDYPPSAYSGAIADVVTPSHNLAESLVGRDGFGYHPNSQWNALGTDLAGNSLYYPDFAPVDDVERDANLASRNGPYLELENANAVKLGDIAPTGFAQLNKDAYVLVDMYKQVKNAATVKEVGLPILYYKANTRRIGNDATDWPNSTYNFNDNYCGNLGFISDTTDTLDDVFYGAIQNPNFPGPPARPYRAESFILQSAGPDGLYCTTDDVFNFDQDN